MTTAIAAETKICKGPLCKTEEHPKGRRHPITAFHKSSNNKDGRYAWCKDCTRHYRKTRYQQNPTDRKANIANSIAWQKKNRERSNETKYKYALKKNYGLTPEQRKEMEVKQNNCCMICGKPPSKKNKLEMKLCTDHNHVTKVLRELLCRPCNLGIGQLLEDPVLLVKACRYLIKHDPELGKNPALVVELLGLVADLEAIQCKAGAQ